jgi:hypothetical protein
MARYMAISEAEDWVLATLYFQLNEEDRESSTVDEIMEFVPGNLTRGICRRAAKGLWERRLVSSDTTLGSNAIIPSIAAEETKYFRDFNPNNITLSNDGIKTAEIFLEQNTIITDIFYKLYDMNNEHNKESNQQDSKLGHTSGKSIDLEEKEEEIEKSIQFIDSTIKSLNSDNNIDKETREASLSSLESAKQNFLKRGKHYVRSLLDPILIGLKNALEKATTEITKTVLMEALEWFSKIFGSDS